MTIRTAVDTIPRLWPFSPGALGVPSPTSGRPLERARAIAARHRARATRPAPLEVWRISWLGFEGIRMHTSIRRTAAGAEDYADTLRQCGARDVRLARAAGR